jgi:tetratricopeptide (TPR) repeat protein
MKLRNLLSVGLLVAGGVCSQAQDSSTLSGTLSENGKPVASGMVILERLKNEKCARLFQTPTQGWNVPQKSGRELESCSTELSPVYTDEKGNYSYPQLSPGWYDIRFWWLLSDAPAAREVLICEIAGWSIVFAPGKEKTGRYNGLANGMPFELKAKESRQLSFDYQNQLRGSPGCDLLPLQQQGGSRGKAQISIPGERGVLELDPGPTLWRLDPLPGDKEVRLQALDRPDHLLVTAFLQKVDFAPSPEKCRDTRWPESEKRLRDQKAHLEDLKQISQTDTARVEFMLRKFQGQDLGMRDVHVYLGSGNLCAEVHLSKIQFQPEQEKLFDQVLATVKMRLDQSAAQEPDNREAEYIAEGSRLSQRQRYAAAAESYQKALDMEKQTRTLSNDSFRVLVDNLGTSYGIGGNLARAKETFEYGISQYPQYPLFYYKMACTYGEMGKMEESLQQLRLAYKYKPNMIAGESFPDALKDASFRNFVSDEKFVKAVRDMQRQ